MGNKKFKTFEDLDCWKACTAVRRFITELVTKYPKDEKFALVDDMKRAARSTTHNIAEGYGRFHYQENMQFCRTSRGSLHNEKGVALFLVLWVLMLLMVIVMEFCRTMRTEVNMTRNFKEETEAYYIAEAGLNRAVRELIKSGATPPTPGAAANEQLGNVFSQFLKNTPGQDTGDDLEEDESEKPVWRVDADIPPISFGGGAYKVSIGNESGKIDINRADEKLLKMLLDAFDLEELDKSIIIDSIMDWRDPDDLHRLNGAEDDYYESLSPSYESRDAPLVSLEELLLVRGVTRELYFGGLSDMLTVYSPTSLRGNAASNLFAGLSGARPAAGNPAASGGAIKINIAAASPLLLRSLPLMTDELVEEILAYRKTDGFTSLTEVNTIVGPEVYAAIRPLINLKNSVYYTIRSEGALKDNPVRRGVGAMVMLDPRVKKKYRIIWRRDE
ncbi:MAG: four helix bundle protein [Desulfobacterales bacterium]|nr:four helix bundle protein [Desulfobacterales bacterium]